VSGIFDCLLTYKKDKICPASQELLSLHRAITWLLVIKTTVLLLSNGWHSCVKTSSTLPLHLPAVQIIYLQSSRLCRFNWKLVQSFCNNLFSSFFNSVHCTKKTVGNTKYIYISEIQVKVAAHYILSTSPNSWSISVTLCWLLYWVSSIVTLCPSVSCDSLQRCHKQKSYIDSNVTNHDSFGVVTKLQPQLSTL